jgi:hypothetical protein
MKNASSRSGRVTSRSTSYGVCPCPASTGQMVKKRRYETETPSRQPCDTPLHRRRREGCPPFQIFKIEKQSSRLAMLAWRLHVPGRGPSWANGSSRLVGDHQHHHEHVKGTTISTSRDRKEAPTPPSAISYVTWWNWMRCTIHRHIYSVLPTPFPKSASEEIDGLQR